MTTDQDVVAIDRNEPEHKDSPWRRVGALVGAAAIVIAAVAGIALLRGGSDTVAAPPYATAEDAARATTKAINLGDWDAYRSGYADHATNDFSPGRAIGENEEAAEGRFNLVVALGTNLEIESCTAIGEGSVTCRVTRTDSYLDALSSPPFVADITYGIEDGLLVYQGQPTSFELSPVLEAYLEWRVESKHPDVEAENDLVKDPIGKDPAVVVAGVLDAIDEFLAQYDG